MSYIRCLSNPEALYIWADLDGSVHIQFGAKEPLRMPTGIFNGLIRKFNKKYGNGFGLDIDEVLKHRGASLTYVKRGKNFKVRLAYHGKLKDAIIKWECFMWEVTWLYIARSNNNR